MKNKFNEQDEEKLVKLDYMAGILMPNLPYHNKKHADYLVSTALLIADEEGIDYDGRLSLAAAGFSHDIVVEVIRNNGSASYSQENEKRSALFVRHYFPLIGFSDKIAKDSSRLVLATKMPQIPQDLLEEIICDADLWNFGGDEFFECGDGVRKELGIPEGRGWYEGSLKLLEGHKYHTKSARKLRNEGKYRNILKLFELIKNGGKLK
ncbi:MAG: hypothetical protein ABIH72_02340 [archaeon]